MLQEYEHLGPRLRDEALFSDADYRVHMDNLNINPTMLSKYSEPRDRWDWRQFAAMSMGDIEGKSLLDFGCGMGEESIYFARLGAHVTAIDISQVGIEITRRRAEHNGLGDRIDALVMRADPTQLPSESFDLIHGLGILHHLPDLEQALLEIRRLLKPNGTAIFLEPLGNSPVVESIKEWLLERIDKNAVTEHEENLRVADLERHAGLFSSMEIHPYHLLYRVKRFFPEPVRDYLRRIDHQVLSRFPQLAYYAGAAVIRLRR
ncbi:MAG TPA: class I SAM-dependent methyltransferase [Haliangium sp.]|nr:class I SAM-dependent methyltransferase [Haliangium sp.]